MFSKKKNNNEEYLSPTAQPLKLTTIAVGTILKGTVDVEGSLRIDGTIEGDIYTCKLEVEPTACFNGNCNTIKETKQPAAPTPEPPAKKK